MNKLAEMTKQRGGRLTVLLAVVSLVFGADAETIAWYRFGEGTPGERVPASTTIQNAANPGVLTGYCRQVDSTGTLSDTDTGYFPIQTNAFPSTLGVTDPVGLTKAANDRTFYFHTSKWDAWNGVSKISNADQGSSSCVIVPYDDALALSDNWTIECFFKSAITNYQSEGFQTILALRNDEGNSGRYSWHIYAHKDGSLRAQVHNYASGTWSQVFEMSSNEGVHDGKWHHVAFRCYSNGQGGYTYSLCLDYAQIRTQNTSTPIYYNSSAALPLSVGCTPGNQYRRWCGWIDEVRISNTNLDPSKFLHLAKYMPETELPDTACYVNYDCVTNLWGTQHMSWKSIDLNCTTSYRPSAYINWASVSAKPVFDEVSRPAPVIYAQSDAGGVYSKLSLTNSASIHQPTNGTGYAASLYVDDRVNSAHTVLNGSFTLECYAKADEKPGERGSYLMHLGKTQTSGWMIALYLPKSGNLEFYVATNSAGNYATIATHAGFCNGAWHHVALTYDREAQTAAAWVDHKCIRTHSGVDFPYDACAASLQVGGGYGTDSDLKFNGWVDEFRMSRRALSKREFLRDIEPVGMMLIYR